MFHSNSLSSPDNMLKRVVFHAQLTPTNHAFSFSQSLSSADSKTVFDQNNFLRFDIFNIHYRQNNIKDNNIIVKNI
jgi:hypothetical protein